MFLWYNPSYCGGMVMIQVFLLLVAYLLGSIPFSYLLGKWFKGKNIRQLGSGNLGTTNAYRVFGKAIGTAVLVFDMLKSGLVVFLLHHTDWFDGYALFHPLVYGFFAMLGHVFPVWFKFKGGKGVASAFGMLIAYQPLLGVFILPIFLLVEYWTRIVSVASTVAALATMLLVLGMHWWIAADRVFVIITFLGVMLIIIRHRSNFLRLVQGTENRVKLFDGIDRWCHSRQANNPKK